MRKRRGTPLIMANTKPRCRIYLQIPAMPTAKLESQLSQALDSISPACVLLCDNGETAEKVPADGLIDRVQGAGIACLIENDIDRAECLGADGVHIAADPDLYARARALLGVSANIGARCGLDRHAAMLLAEAGADYVAFGESGGRDHIDQYTEIIGWWSEVFVVPSIAWNVDTVAEAEQLARLGVDFVAPSQAIWQSENAAAIIAGIDTAIGRIRRAA